MVAGTRSPTEATEMLQRACALEQGSSQKQISYWSRLLAKAGPAPGLVPMRMIMDVSADAIRLSSAQGWTLRLQRDVPASWLATVGATNLLFSSAPPASGLALSLQLRLPLPWPMLTELSPSDAPRAPQACGPAKGLAPVAHCEITHIHSQAQLDQRLTLHKRQLDWLFRSDYCLRRTLGATLTTIHPIWRPAIVG